MQAIILKMLLRTFILDTKRLKKTMTLALNDEKSSQHFLNVKPYRRLHLPMSSQQQD